MKTFSTPITLLLLVAMTLLIGCEENPADSDRRGTLYGRVELYDMESQKLSNHGGIRVAVLGTNFQAVTAADGSWSIPDLPAGTYSLTFGRNDCREHRIFRYEFAGEDDSLYDIPMTVSDLDFTFTTFRSVMLPQGVRFSGSLSRPELKNRAVQIYLGTTPDVSATLGTFTFDFPASAFHSPAMDSAGNEDVDFSYQYIYDFSKHLPNAAIVPGTRLYARAYLSSGLFTGYDDISTHLKQRTNLSIVASEVVSFTMP